MIAALGARIAKASYLNILNKLDIVKNGTTTIPEATTAISGIHLGTIILQARKLGAEEADCYSKQLARGRVYHYSVGIAH